MIRRNLSEIQYRIEKCSQNRSNSEPAPRLVAVTKYAELSWIEALLQLGCRDLGESRPQQLGERAEKYSQVAGLNWHMIGHLQRNKVRMLLPIQPTIHSVDSLRLLKRIEDVAKELNLKPKILLEINVAGEAQKTGMSLSEWKDLQSILPEISHCEIQGLMTMAPKTEDETRIRGTFRTLRELRDNARNSLSRPAAFPELSMGMSGDYEIAIEEGATMVRIGSSLFRGLESASG